MTTKELIQYLKTTIMRVCQMMNLQQIILQDFPRYKRATIVPIPLSLHGWCMFKEASDVLNDLEWIQMYQKYLGSWQNGIL